MTIKTWIGTDGAYATGANWSPANVPVNGDVVRMIPGKGSSIISGFAQGAVTLDAFLVEDECPWLIGSRTLGPLVIKANRFEYAGIGESWIDLSSNAVSPIIRKTISPASGYCGLYLVGTAINVLDVSGGTVGLAANPSEVSTVTTARVTGTGGELWLGTGTTLTNLHQHNGKAKLRCNVGAVLQYGGTLTTEEAAAITAGTLFGGTMIANATGTIAAITIDGGELDMLQSNAARIVSAIAWKRGKVKINPNAVTVTAYTFPNPFSGNLSAS